VPHVPVTLPSKRADIQEQKNNVKGNLSTARIARIVIGVVVICLALWAFVPGMIYPISSNAIVNAQVMTIRAPIQGEVTKILSAETLAIKKGDIIARIEDSRIDRSKLAALMADRATLHETILALEQEVKELEYFLTRLEKSGKAYYQSVNKHYQVMKAEKEAKLVAQQAILKDSQSKLARQTALFSKGLTTRAQLDAALRDDAVAHADLVVIEREIERVKVELDAAKDGVYFGDGFNNVPYSQQRSDEIGLRQQTVVSKLRDANIRVREVARQIKVEKERLAHVSESELIAPNNGRIWLRLVGEGEHVTAGTPMLQIADLSRLFLIVSLDERYFDDVSIGDSASIDLIGSPHDFHGRVERLQGRKSTLPESMLAVAQPNTDKNDFLVFVTMDINDFKDDSKIFNQVGRRAKVTFHKEDIILPVTDEVSSRANELSKNNKS